jgi:hypothetical protein
MPTSLAVFSEHTRPIAAPDFWFWFLLALPIAGFALAVLSMNAFAPGVSAAILEVARAGI